MTLYVIGTARDRLYTFTVHVKDCDDVEEIDVVAGNEDEARLKAHRAAGELDEGFTLRLAVVI